MLHQLQVERVLVRCIGSQAPRPTQEANSSLGYDRHLGRHTST